MKNHRQEKEKLDGQDRVIARGKIKSARHGAKDEAEKTGDQQKVDGDPGEGLKGSAPLVQELDSCHRGQGMDRRSEDKKKKGDPAYPKGERQQVEPEVEAAKKNPESHFSP